MAEHLEVCPATRIEGNAEIVFDGDNVFFRVVEFRGFEKFLEGRHFEYVPRFTARICGVCPVAHAVASAKAVENAANIDIPEKAKELREILLLAQNLQSHALHVFFMALPDYFCSSDCSVFSIDKDMAKLGISLRSIAQKIVSEIAVRATHPEVVPGGVVKDISNDRMSKYLDIVRKLLRDFVDLTNTILEKFECGEVYNDSYYLCINNDGYVNFYDGKLAVFGENDSTLFLAEEYDKYISEESRDFSYAKFPLFRGNLYRVGPLARANIGKYDTEIAEKMRSEVFNKIRNEILITNYARVIEIVYSLEKILYLAENLSQGNIRVDLPDNISGVGVAAVEAPRGTLIHKFEIEKGIVKNLDLLVPTTQNNTAINEDIKVAWNRHRDKKLIEKIVRAYDPCISCSSH